MLPHPVCQREPSEQAPFVKVALNSDHMEGFDPDTSLNPYNPFVAIQKAVTRRKSNLG